MNAPLYTRPRSLFGPLMIVVIGVLFLLRNIGVISYGSLGWWFSRYWPLLLIVWGIFKLVEHFWARSRGLPAPRSGAGSVLFLIFLIVAGLAATRAARVNWDAVRSQIDIDTPDDFKDSLGILGHRYEFTEEGSQSLSDAAQVKVVSERGDIKVVPSPDSQAHILLHKFIRAGSSNEANRVNNSLHPRFTRQGNQWVLDMTGDDFDIGRFDLELQLPRDQALSLTTRHGAIHVSQRDARVELEAGNGDITAEDIQGGASLRLHGDATVKNIRGDVSVDGNVGNSHISDIKGTLTLTGIYTGDMDLARIAKEVRFNTSRTSLQFARLDGSLSMDSGDLHASSIAGPLQLSTKDKEINLEGVSGDVHIENSSGGIQMRAQAPLGNIDIANAGESITLNLPEHAGFRLDAQTDEDGEIQTDFGLSVNNVGNNVKATGTVGKGGPEVRLKTDSATIQVRKG